MSDIWASFVKLRKELRGCDSFGKNVYGSHYQRVLFARKQKETTLRFIIKSMISKILFDEGVSFVTEWKYFKDNKVFDSMPVINVETKDIYRFGKRKIEIKHKGFKDKNIDISKLNIDLKTLKKLEDKLREMLGFGDKK